MDDRDSYADLTAFVDSVVAASGVRLWSLHSRKALLNGISPAQNRSVPPLKYDVVYSLKQDFSALHVRPPRRPPTPSGLSLAAREPNAPRFPALRGQVTINGGINTLADARAHLARGADGVMLGRAVWHDPMLLAAADEEIYGKAPPPGRRPDKASVLLEYARRVRGGGARPGRLSACAALLWLSLRRWPESKTKITAPRLRLLCAGTRRASSMAMRAGRSR